MNVLITKLIKDKDVKLICIPNNCATNYIFMPKNKCLKLFLRLKISVILN